MQSSSTPASKWLTQQDAVAIICLVALCALTSFTYFSWEVWLHKYDTFGYFLPTFDQLGDRLRDFDIPAWNSYYFGGQPFIGDPASGWMYLPAMAAFTFFNAITGFKVLVLLCSVIGSVALYMFTRSVGFSTVPALTTSVAFAIGSIVSGFMSAGIAVSMTYPIIAVGILSAERALRSRSVSALFAWSALGGVAFVHCFASWPTNGLMYVAMYVGGWLTYRSLIEPDKNVGSRVEHLKRAVWYGLIVILVAVTVGGAVIWPVLNFSNQSLISGADYSQVDGAAQAQADPIFQTLAYPFMFQWGYSIWTYGGMVIIPAILALVLGWNRIGTLYFAACAFVFIDLSAQGSILRPVFDLVPFFELIHDHRPATSSTMMYPAVLLLGGAGLQLFLEEKNARKVVIGIVLALVAFFGLREACSREGFIFDNWAIGSVVATASLLALSVIPLPKRSANNWLIALRSQIAAVILLIMTILYPVGINSSWASAKELVSISGEGVSRSEWSPVPEASYVDVPWILETTFSADDPGSAAEFLKRQYESRQPFRYATYFDSDRVGYAVESPAYVALLDRARAATLGLEHISGYNPIGLKFYSEYIEIMNGRAQDYHYRDLYAYAMESRGLMSMMNVRYVIVLASLPAAPPIAYYGTEVYRDNFVIVYENPFALPRAWMVHNVLPSTNWQDELIKFNTSQIDPRGVAFVSGDVPAFSPLQASDPADSVLATSNQPELLKFEVTTAADGLLVVSNVYANGWNAYVDGKQVDLVRTNHALQGVPVTAGEHEVVLRYEPRSLTIGLWSTGISSVAVVGIWCWAASDTRRRKTTFAGPTAFDQSASGTAIDD